MKTIKEDNYLFLYYLEDILKKQIAEYNDNIKAYGETAIITNLTQYTDKKTNTKKNNIRQETYIKDALPIFDAETTAKIMELEKQIAEIKATAKPINEGETVTTQKVLIHEVPKKVKDDVMKLFENIHTNNDSTGRQMSVAKIMAKASSKSHR
jgi:hypothetical protein